MWLDLTTLFTEPRRVEPLVQRLTDALRPYAASIVCGPLLGGALVSQLVARGLQADFCFVERATVSRAGALFGAQYRLPPALVPRMRGKRVAIVDDVMSAGSALRGTFTAVQSSGASTVVAAALLVLGGVGAGFFAEQGVPVEAVTRGDYDIWLPPDCPWCAAGVPLEDVALGSHGL